MKPLTWVMVAALIGGAGFVDRADARDGRRDDRSRRVERRSGTRHAVPRIEDRRIERHVVERRRDYDDRGPRYFADRDIVVIRDYYRPRYRPLPPGLRHRYYRAGYLPPGWATRIVQIPVYVERRLPVLPRGYRRGIIDGHAVVYNPSGLIIDVAVLF